VQVLPLAIGPTFSAGQYRMNAEFIGLIVSLVLTLMVFSYLLGENPLSGPLYRLALHLFIGAAAGYTVAVALRDVLWPRLILPILEGAALAGPIFPVIPLLLSLLLLLKVSSGTIGRLGNLAVAFLVGVGAAVAVGGAITGTLFPQITAGAQASSYPFADVSLLFSDPGVQLERLVSAGIFFVGTLTTLMYFFFIAPPKPGGGTARHPVMAGLASIGQFFIMVAYGALYAGALAASLAVLTDRVAYLWTAIGTLSGLQ
jgi:hypothetical protein